MELGLTANRYGVPLGRDANALKLDCDGRTVWQIYRKLLGCKMMLTLHELHVRESNTPPDELSFARPRGESLGAVCAGLRVAGLIC